jgi:hypothetical protein
MIKVISFFLCITLFVASACNDILDPQPINLQVAELALNDANDVGPVVTGLYSALRTTGAPTIIAGDFTADMVTHRGTFTQYRELGTKQITPANAAVSALWGSLYSTIYIANFILERIPNISGIPAARRREVLATARFMRGYAYFIGVHTYGDMPLVTTTDRSANRNIPRTSRETIISFIEEDYLAALPDLPVEPASIAFIGRGVVQAALARFYLYQRDWTKAEQYATQVITSGKYTLVSDFVQLVQQDFTTEAILELGYTANDDPGTSDLGLNNIFVGRREVVPSNEILDSLYSPQSGDRRRTVNFDPARLRGTDNGFIVAKYGNVPNDLENNNIVLFRLGEMYLIRAEARAWQGRISGANSAEEDINVLRARAKAPNATANTQNQMLSLVLRERIYELAYEGHRWYDLKRTNRLNQVMSTFSRNWRPAFELWPVPQREIQSNPGLANAQNPGY